jgi:hypothetical protein
MEDRQAITVEPGQGVAFHMAPWGPSATWATYTVDQVTEREQYTEVCLVNPEDAEDTMTLRFERLKEHP